jgi:hypothetical protein
MRKTGQRMSRQAVNRDKLIEGLSFKILRDKGTGRETKELLR